MAADISLVHEFLENSASQRPDHICLVCQGQRFTYREIEARANRLAHALLSRGVRRGDRVALFLPNSVELVVGIFAVLKAGAVFVAINPTTRRDKLAYILRDSGAALLLAGPPQAEWAGPEPYRRLLAEISTLRGVILVQDPPEPAGGETGERVVGLSAAMAGCPDRPPPRANIDLDLACLIYTSGSTGEPKGVMSDHSNVVFAVRSITTYLQNHPGDVVLNVLPLSFDYGLYQLFMVFSFGGTLVLEPGFVFPAAVLKRIAEERVTGFPGVPTIFSVLLNLDLSPYDLSSLRYMTNTAAALPPAHIQRLREKFPWVTLYSMYGLTETKRALYLPPEELDRRPGSVGIAIPGTEVWLEDGSGRRLGPGETGELVVRGRHVMRGYWNDPQATAERFRPGPLPGERVCYTGDLFRMDEDGFLYFVARSDDIIKSRGEKVAPKEVENVLYRLEGVREAAVIGVSDPVLGQAIKAFVVVEGDRLSDADILRHCRAHLEDFMVPRFVQIVPELPKTPSGKIRKTGLA